MQREVTDGITEIVSHISREDLSKLAFLLDAMKLPQQLQDAPHHFASQSQILSALSLLQIVSGNDYLAGQVPDERRKEARPNRRGRGERPGEEERRRERASCRGGEEEESGCIVSVGGSHA